MLLFWATFGRNSAAFNFNVWSYCIVYGCFCVCVINRDRENEDVRKWRFHRPWQSKSRTVSFRTTPTTARTIRATTMATSAKAIRGIAAATASSSPSQKTGNNVVLNAMSSWNYITWYHNKSILNISSQLHYTNFMLYHSIISRWPFHVSWYLFRNTFFIKKTTYQGWWLSMTH